MRNKLIVAVAASALLCGQMAVTLYSTEAVAQAPVAAGELAPAQAAEVARNMSKTLDQAVREGLMSKLPNGNYVVNESGARVLAALGAPIGGFSGLSALQITALIAVALGLTFIAADIVDDAEGPGAAPTPTPTPRPTATPVTTATPGPTATPAPTATPVTTATPVPTATPLPTPTPGPTTQPTPIPTAVPTAVPTAPPTTGTGTGTGPTPPPTTGSTSGTK